MASIDKMLKFKHKKKKAKGRPRTKVDRSLSDDLSDPAKAARVEWVLDLYSSMISRVGIVRHLCNGQAANLKTGRAEILPISNKEAYRYFNLALRILEDESQQSVEEKAKWYKAQMIGLARQARRKQPLAAAEILERAATFDGMGAPGSGPPPAKAPTELSDEELASRIEAAKKIEP